MNLLARNPVDELQVGRAIAEVGGTSDFDPTRSWADNLDILSIGSRQNPGQDVFILELSQTPAGALEFAWVGNVGGSGLDLAFDIAFDGSGVYVLGEPEADPGSDDFDPDPSIRYGFYDAGPGLSGEFFLLKLTNSETASERNKFDWVKGMMGLNGGSGGWGRLALDGQGNVYVAGYNNAAWLDLDIETSYPGNGDRLPDRIGQSDVFVAAYTSGGVFSWAALVASDASRDVWRPVVTATNTGVQLAAGSRSSTITFSPGGPVLGDPNGTIVLARYTQTADPTLISINDVSIKEGNAGTQTATFTVSLSGPSDQTVTVNYATADGTATTADNDYLAAGDTLTFLPGQTSKTISITVNGDTAIEPNENFFVNLSGETNATLADAQGTGTILDDDSTKFYVVDDATGNRTYEYGSGGVAVEDYALNSGNTAPRGAASNAAGDKVWVVDASKTVHVYNAAGALLGSWTAGGLNAQAQVEDIATNGTDIWIVDAKQDKVFRYTNAASRTSGSQNAASNFSLNSGNKDPKGLVTDGASLWVVNNSTTDKVFKYTLSGALLGSWTISGGGGSPTGITLDPSAPGHLWIVDNATDRVYQFDGAMSLVSGSQSASASFALAAGNTNPQGIADPPPPEMLLAATPEPSSQPSAAPALPGVDWAWFADPAPWDRSEPLTSSDPGEPNHLDRLTVLASDLGPPLRDEPIEDAVREPTLMGDPRRMHREGSLPEALIVLDQVFADSAW
ncbi:MAG: hypothetical protein L0Z62_47815 [Gemmataceae bacterium]|nr:hypothetical protein [Gemmataceae bacterium]